ncbi:MAG: phosphatase PAP2 family protein [Puniceicoccales bacterium]|jgi:membrane-associated phospholipid phosphatase|nr:phosphatase PAP2 family protein [Puniceicoccales bacterium]
MLNFTKISLQKKILFGSHIYMKQTNKCAALLAMLALAIFAPVNQVRANDFQTMGDILQFAIPAYAFGLAWQEEGYKGTKQFFYSLAASELSVYVLKTTTHRPRPNYQEGDKKNSFPSGHTAAAFTGASFIHRRYGFKQAIIPYGLAIATGMSRIHAKKHHTWDVVAGAAIACLWSWCFVEKKTNIVIDTDGEFTKIAYEVNF